LEGGGIELNGRNEKIIRFLGKIGGGKMNLKWQSYLRRVTEFTTKPTDTVKIY
jgi:hypothetical protein